MRVYLESLGCRLNYAEMSALGRRLEAAGHELIASAGQADLCVLNSCAVTDEAARKSRQLARQLAHRNPHARLVVTGCYATLEGEAAGALPNVSLVVGNARKDDLAALVEAEGRKLHPDSEGREAKDEGAAPNCTGSSTFGAGWAPAEGQTGKGPSRSSEGAPGPCGMAAMAGGAGLLAASPLSRSRTRTFVKVQDGCRNRCTYCIVTVARGDERSQPIAEVVEEVTALDREGCQEVVLTGVHLGAYGRDRGETLRALIRTLLAETRVSRLRLSSLEPFDLDPAFFDLWAESDGRLMPHLHLPAQSGSATVLRRMARHVPVSAPGQEGVAGFEALVESARAHIPGLTITTDLIAGFPGERESDFAETVAFARRVGFAHIHVFPYSARRGTAAAQFDGQVPEPERRRRSQVLRDLDVELGQTVRRGHVGEIRPVLWEHPVGQHNAVRLPLPVTAPGQADSYNLKEGREVELVTWSGLTDNYLRVFAPVPAGTGMHNRITMTPLVGIAGGELWGEIVALCKDSGAG